jgi:N-acetylglucosamine kinase-like BadF-type ATPase
VSGPELLLAVDGGGTKTQALIADLEGKVIARGLGPDSNQHRVGFDRFCKALTTAIDGALRNVLGPRALGDGIWREARIAAACFGLAGVDGPEDEAQVSAWIKTQKITPAFVVVNDSELVLAAGTPAGWGVALISGTGSVCLGRSHDGRNLRVGGWGPLMGDEGSGYQIALSALHAVTQTADGRASADDLLRVVLRHWSLPDPQSLIRHVYQETMTQADIAGLATVVLNLAGRGDATAASIVNEAARELAGQVHTVVRRLKLDHPPLALAGDVLRGALRNTLKAEIGDVVGPVQFVADPSVGAIVLARRVLMGAALPS